MQSQEQRRFELASHADGRKSHVEHVIVKMEHVGLGPSHDGFDLTDVARRKRVAEPREVQRDAKPGKYEGRKPMNLNSVDDFVGWHGPIRVSCDDGDFMALPNELSRKASNVRRRSAEDGRKQVREHHYSKAI